MQDSDNWQSVHEVAKRLREKAVDAMNKGLFEIAETYDMKATQLLLEDWINGEGKDK